MKIFKFILLSSVLFVNTSAMALSTDTEAKTSKTFDSKAIASKLLTKLGLQADVVQKSSMLGMAEVITKQGLLYVSYDGNFIIQGKLYNIEKDVVDLTETTLSQMRADGVKKFEKSIISYPAKNEQHVVTIFTDITCGYCRKLHEQMEAYNNLGITVQYLAYPRAGIRDQVVNYSQSYKDLRSIWCNETPDKALTNAKSGGQVAQRICELPLEEQYDFGRQIGVSGTPAIILDNGMMIPGYQPPERLAQMLNSL